MKKLAQKRIKSQTKGDCLNNNNSTLRKQKRQTLKDISHHLQQIGMKVMGVCVTEEDELSFLKIYSNLSAAQATHFRYKAELSQKRSETLPSKSFMNILPKSFQGSILPN